MPTAYGSKPYLRATRLTFFTLGLTMAAWAPLVAYAKQRLQLGDGAFGSMLLCIGLGSLLSMPFAGRLARALGLRRVMQLAGLCFSATLVLLAVLDSPVAFGVALLVFGACLGVGDICMNLQAAIVEKAAERPLMSGFHGLFSVGAFAGAAGVTLLLRQGASPLQAASTAAVLALTLLALAYRHQLRELETLDDAAFRWPRGVVAIIALLAFVCLLVEGAMLDWSALYLHDAHKVSLASAGIAYSLFTLSMAAARLLGDRLARHLGDLALLLGGGLLALLGLVLAQCLPLNGALLGFALAGLGLANAVPVLFRAALRQTRMAAASSLSAVATLGYLGVLLGPGFIGHLAELTSLHSAFWALAAGLSLLCLLSRRALAGG
ncbi:MFS transporter [Pseudomonas cremoricolorata]|uniref:MFS transporter n=1 Tax=Pseudomonas cremoricolorata TaxID=157783 RepID=UPI00040D5235|nr:MFS transporter [Pseudomonas cremoricolorata]